MRRAVFPPVSRFVDVPAFVLTGCLVACAKPSEPAPSRGRTPSSDSADLASSAKPPALTRTGPNDGASSKAVRPAAVELHSRLAEYVAAMQGDLEAVAEERRAQLDELALFVKSKRDAGEPAKLTFICTHNSRRSQLSQLWAAVAAAYFGVSGVETYSGGTESTAFNRRAVAALERAGFEISTTDAAAENPRYEVTYSPNGPTLQAFSKHYAEPPNPTEDFAAIMTCSEADKRCPAVVGAALRVPIPYVDPKESDDTPDEAATYDERTRQIAVEMFYLFSKASS